MYLVGVREEKNLTVKYTTLVLFDSGIQDNKNHSNDIIGKMSNTVGIYSQYKVKNKVGYHIGCAI